MTLVVEGGGCSGSLITARFAAEIGREVGAVPGQISSPLAKGPNDLIADGAYVVRSAEDVLDALYGTGERSRQAAAGQREPVLENGLRELLEAVGRGDGSVDEIASDQEDVPRVLAGLTELELMGLIRRVEGGRYIRRV